MAERVVVRSDGALVWFCRHCDKSSTSKSGGVWIDEVDARDAGRRYAEVASKGYLTGSEIAAMDWPRWVSECYECATTEDDGYDYWIDWERIDTLRRFVHWTGHLMSKPWVDHTDWSDLCEIVGTYA